MNKSMTMKKPIVALFLVTSLASTFAFGRTTVRAQPAGWDRVIPGGRFMDRFEPSRPIGKLTSECWGGANVKPRDIRNGMEAPEYSYWGGNITLVDGKYHLFVARWKESEPKGHMAWFWSEIAHCVSDRPDGDFKVADVVGAGHNPELFRCKDGSFAIYCYIKGQAWVYRSASVNGPWTFGRLALDLNGKKLIEGESNFSFTSRPDGSVLAVCRGGAIWLSEDGIKPFVMLTGERVYPNMPGNFEDPVLWRDEVQYHIIVNDWYGRVAWYLTSPDGLKWTTQPGAAYLTRFSYVEGGVLNDWHKYERMRITRDKYGRVFQANFAVIDCVKREDLGSDNHSSKNITIPVNPGRRVTSFKKGKECWEMRIAKEPGFDPVADVVSDSVILGPQTFVAYGQGVKPLSTKAVEGDLVLVFPLVELDSPVVKVLGKEKNGRLFFATCRTDGTKLGGKLD